MKKFMVLYMAPMAAMDEMMKQMSHATPEQRKAIDQLGKSLPSPEEQEKDRSFLGKRAPGCSGDRRAAIGAVETTPSILDGAIGTPLIPETQSPAQRADRSLHALSRRCVSGTGTRCVRGNGFARASRAVRGLSYTNDQRERSSGRCEGSDIRIRFGSNGCLA